jgi:hypothetical protein
MRKGAAILNASMALKAQMAVEACMRAPSVVGRSRSIFVAVKVVFVCLCLFLCFLLLCRYARHVLWMARRVCTQGQQTDAACRGLDRALRNGQRKFELRTKPCPLFTLHHPWQPPAPVMPKKKGSAKKKGGSAKAKAPLTEEERLVLAKQEEVNAAARQDLAAKFLKVGEKKKKKIRKMRRRNEKK